MTTDPPSSAEGSALPPRHRPNMGNLAKDTTEVDLWSIDGSGPEADEHSAAPLKPGQSTFPAPRNIEKMPRIQLRDDAAPQAGAAGDQIKLDVGKPTPRPLHTGGPVNSPKSGSNFATLEQWDELEPDALPPMAFQKIEIGQANPAPAPFPAAKPISGPVTPREREPDEQEEDQFSPPSRENPESAPPRSRWSLSKIEGLGLIALVGMLVFGGIAVFFFTIGRLPTESSRVRANDFPVKGKYLSIQSADSHWRAPGEGDVFRRGTRLLPVVDLVSSGGPAAIRIFFRNSEGELIGDPVTRAIQPGDKLQVAATAGFDDLGMHAAYHTGQNKPWTIEVLEAPLEDSPVSAFVKLFEMNISTERR